ncbi:MAG: HAD family hydrolase [Prevotellaceae bacterium]|nr:HAD family hydrolase [Prevotellaceae bacterium]
MQYPLGKIYAFDFDGTLTKSDSLLEFIRFVKGDKDFLLCFLRFTPLIIAMKLKLYPNWKVKQKVFSYCFKGMKLDDFNNYCNRFAQEKANIMRQKGIEKIKSVLAEGSKAIIISASINNWVEPFFREIGDVFVIGTMIEDNEGIITGRFLTKNCYGKEKVTRLLQLYPERKEYYLTAYGDSRGDMELLDFANESYYKPFRK